MVEVLRVDLDLAGVVEVGVAQRLQVAVVSGVGGEHGRLHQVGQVVLGHVHLDGFLEGLSVDLKGAFHLAAQLGEALLHLALEVLAHLCHHLRHGRLHGGTELGLQRFGDLGRIAFHNGGHGLLHGLRELRLQLVLIEQIAHGTVHQGLEGVALEVLGEADLVQVQDAVANDVILVAYEDFLGKLLNLILRNGKVHVGEDLGQGAHVHVGHFGQVHVELEVVGVQQLAEIHRPVVEVKRTAQVKVQLAGVELEGALELVGIDAEQGGHIKGGSLFGSEGLTVHHIDGGVGQLILHEWGIGGAGDDVLGQGSGVGDTGRKHGRGGIFLRLDNTHDGEGLAGSYEVFQEILVVGLVYPSVVLVVPQVAVGAVHKLELNADKVIVSVRFEVRGDIDVLVLGKLLDHLVQFGVVP